MRLLREHLFYVVLAGSVLVIGGVLLAVSISLSGGIKEKWENRRNIINDLRRLASGTPVNQKILDNRRRYVENIRNTASSVESQSEKFNRGDYQLIQFTLPDGKKENAFPMNRDLYEKHDLAFKLTDKYVDGLESLRNSLKPVPGWTEEDLKQRVQIWEKKLQKMRELEMLEEERRVPRTEEPSAMERYLRGRGGRIPPTGVPEATIAEEAGPLWARYSVQELAIMSLKLDNASEGMVYVTRDALNPVFTHPMPNAMPEECWKAQVHLWVVGDIIAAINETNQQALRSGGTTIKSPNVMNAAVKRLVQIKNVSYAKSGMEGSPRRGVPTGRGRPRRGGRSEAAPAPAPAIDNLTQRAACPEYDVIHYTFTVIMPSRYLPDLQQNLISRNYHTILQWQQSSITEEQSREQDIYYYGIEPIMEITITGELLLLSSWERDLMPVEVLAAEVAPQALRPQDVERLKDARYDTTMLRTTR